MSEVIRFFIKGEPKPWRRPTTVVKDGKRWTTQSKPDLWFAQVDQEVLRNAPLHPYAGAVNMTLHFHLIKPKSAPKKTVFAIKRPDLDNLGKLIIDAMNKRFYLDDSQIVELNLAKSFEDESGCFVQVYFL